MNVNAATSVPPSGSASGGGASGGSASSGSASGGEASKPSDGWREYKPSIARWVFIAPALLALTLIGNGAWQASHRGTATTTAHEALVEAFGKVPFKVRLPATVPEAAEMVRVYLDEPDSEQGFQAYQLNVWYRTPGPIESGGGRSFHLWQSNDKFLARRLADQSAPVGTAETIAGQEWRRVIDDRVRGRVVTTFSRRFSDGITMTVDSSDPSLARQAIAAMAIAATPPAA